MGKDAHTPNCTGRWQSQKGLHFFHAENKDGKGFRKDRKKALLNEGEMEEEFAMYVVVVMAERSQQKRADAIGN